MIYNKYKNDKEILKNFLFSCKCGITEKEEHMVYDTSKGKMCTKCFLELLGKGKNTKGGK